MKMNAFNAGKKLVTALRVYEPTRCEHPISFDAKPPQNWGRFAYQTRQASHEGGEK